MKAALEDAFPGIVIELIKSKGGAFEVRRDGALIYSKKATGRFPANQEIVKSLRV